MRGLCEFLCISLQNCLGKLMNLLKLLRMEWMMNIARHSKLGIDGNDYGNLVNLEKTYASLELGGNVELKPSSL